MNLRPTIALSLALATLPAYADDAALQQKIDTLEQQLQTLKGELDKVGKKADEANARTDMLAERQESAAGNGGAASMTSLFGYGEITYTRPSQNPSQAQVDVARAVIGIGHRFNEQLKFASEFEFEHAVASATDAGEAEVEQFYVDYALTGSTNLKTGLYLMPVGLLNESHEPTHYYGVFRNDVETRIIPTTWREVGVGIYGSSDVGIQYDLGLSSGFSIHKWDAKESPSAPLASVHQEGQFANANDIAFYGALHYIGTPGLRAGGALWSGNSTQGNAPFTSGTSTVDLSGISGRITLWDVDAAYASGKLDLKALYARGKIGQAGQIDDALTTAGFTGGFVPAEFDGGYVQAAYRVVERNDQAITPFVRWERYNTQKEMPSGYATFVDPKNNEHVLTYGASFFLSKDVVFKADYQRYQADPSRNRFNLGLGLVY